MVSQTTKIARVSLGRDWLDTSDAARALGTVPKVLNERIRPMITHKSRSLSGRGARYVGWAYLRKEISALAEIKRITGGTAIDAARVLWAMRRLGATGALGRVLEVLEHQHDVEDSKQ
jgi:hypothetical protein